MNQRGFTNTFLPFISSDRRPLFLFIIFFAISIQLIAFLLLFGGISFTKVLLVLIGIPLLIYLLFSVENFFIVIVIYISCFHMGGYHEVFRGFVPFGVEWRHLYTLYTLLIVYWIFSTFLKRRKIKITPLGYSIIVFSSISLLSFVHGLINGYFQNVRKIFISDIFPPLMYLTYFIFITSNLSNMKKRIFFDFILVASVFIGLQLLYAFRQNGISTFTRINTNTVQISLLAFPYVLGILYFTKSLRRKLISVLALIPISFSVLISLQRSLWLALIIVFVFSLFTLFYKRGFSFKKILGLSLGGILGFLFVILIAVFVLSKITSGAAILVLLKRFISLVSIAHLRVDASAYTRLTEIKQALSKIVGIQWLIGRGIGDTFYSFLRTKTKVYLDNSYAWVLWKMGIVGLISFLAMFFVFFHRVVILIRKNLEVEDTIYIMTISLNMLGVMICSLGNASLVKFRYIIIWAVSMAIMDVIYSKYKNENTANLLK
ncbi:MAG: hypothetical protein B5M53_00490 [Candidatus Cloacimonas sp. 4484_209]|nr:MAG: hypothetical protein B5M53_00490 [Candidatus Cloacimonas sp. 4484_209]